MTAPPTEPAATRPPPRLWTYDVPVVVGALAVLLAAWVVHATLTRPVLATFQAEGLRFRYPKGWYPREEAPGHWWYESIEDPSERIEVRVAPAPPLAAAIATAMEFERTTQAGGLYKRLERGEVEVAGRRWIRTRFSYAFKRDDEAAPALATGIEYALVNGDKLYVVTAHGPEAQVDEMERRVLGTVTVQTP